MDGWESSIQKAQERKRAEREAKKRAKTYYTDNADFIDNFHNRDNLTFEFMHDSKPEGREYHPIHHSSGNGRQGSRYWVGYVNDRPAYIRNSNHWGPFGGEHNFHIWELNGTPKGKDGFYRRTSQTGYVYLDDLIGEKKPEIADAVKGIV